MNKIFPKEPRNTIETTLVILLLLSLFIALYSVLQIFFGVLTFALIFSVSFAGPFERLVAFLNNRRRLAAIIYSILLTAIIVLPFGFLIASVRVYIREALVWVSGVKVHGLPPLPQWMANLPLVGEDVQTFWQQLQDSPQTVLHDSERLRMLLHRLLAGGLGMLATALQFLLGIFLSAYFLSSGSRILSPLRSAMEHLLGRRDGLTLLAATTQAIKGVSIGMIGTAFIASVIAWIGLAIAGVNFSLVLAGIVFFLVLIQLGPLLVWVPLVIWSFIQGNTPMTIFLIVYGGALLVIDAFLKPLLIAKSGGRLPFLVMFFGVIGGLAAWGFTGMFKGAIIMAVFYTVFTSWLQRKRIGAS